MRPTMNTTELPPSRFVGLLERENFSTPVVVPGDGLFPQCGRLQYFDAFTLQYTTAKERVGSGMAIILHSFSARR